MLENSAEKSTFPEEDWATARDSITPAYILDAFYINYKVPRNDKILSGMFHMSNQHICINS